MTPEQRRQMQIVFCKLMLEKHVSQESVLNDLTKRAKKYDLQHAMYRAIECLVHTTESTSIEEASEFAQHTLAMIKKELQGDVP